MKIKFTEEGVTRELEVRRLRVVDKDGYTFRIEQDIERGIDVLADTLDGRFCVEPHTGNEVTLSVWQNKELNN
jgi:hypothetical protein